MLHFGQETELPVSAAGVPEIVLTGFGEVIVEQQRGLLAYAPEEVVVALPSGRVSVSGSGLRIVRMKERQIVLRGEIAGVRLEREA